jgi:predicted RNase H-like nuclease (RuvC/YqgF family)
LIEEDREHHAEDEIFLKKTKVMNELDDCIYKLRNALKNKQSSISVLKNHLKGIESMLEDIEIKNG